jgi:hypothetical protein
MAESRDKDISELMQMLRALSGKFDAHTQKLDCVVRKIDELMSAFPEEGFVQHRLYHEDQHTKEQERRELRNSLRKALVFQGVLLTLGLVLYALWEYIKVRVHQ